MPIDTDVQYRQRNERPVNVEGKQNNNGKKTKKDLFFPLILILQSIKMASKR